MCVCADIICMTVAYPVVAPIQKLKLAAAAAADANEAAVDATYDRTNLVDALNIIL